MTWCGQTARHETFQARAVAEVYRGPQALAQPWGSSSRAVFESRERREVWSVRLGIGFGIKSEGLLGESRLSFPDPAPCLVWQLLAARENPTLNRKPYKVLHEF